MGSVTGHCGPGLAFILQGTWWAFHAWRRYIRSRAQQRPYVSRAWYPLHCVPRLACFEGVAKIVCCLIGLVIEYITAFEGGKLVYASHYHHVSMYFFYATSGVVEILMYKGPTTPGGFGLRRHPAGHGGRMAALQLPPARALAPGRPRTLPSHVHRRGPGTVHHG
ncbi:hypothetical protein HPB48_014534 [Haemaphysalis longicornis]|uniref:Uncharacterized protein n=1 Tax=Haemaphysalis longicornis TaxID=44386 RepID=A0A9J6H104_HAELO|nr:hypothetical protein HPB48_014534 [Haemaphysalis longicornis]